LSIEIDLSKLFESLKLEKYATSPSAAPTDAVSRKANWEKSVSDFGAMELWLPDWELLFEEYGINWSFNFTFNFLLDLTLTLDFHLEFDVSFDFLNEFKDFIWDEFGFEIDIIRKGYYDVTEYLKSYFDPDEITGNDLRKFTWWLRYKTTDKKFYRYKYSDVSAKTITETNKNLVYQQMVRDWLLNGFEAKIAVFEGKVINSFYVGFGLVGISKVTKKLDENSYGYAKLYVRNPENWKEILELETTGIYDTHAGFMTVGFSRVGISKKQYYEFNNQLHRRVFSKETADRLKENVERGRRQLGVDYVETEYGKIPYMPARMMAYASAEKKKWSGGKHQALMHHNTQVVKQILDKHGIAGMFRRPYLDFAMELTYYKYNTRNKMKIWKRILSSDEELIEKYITYGCDENVLREISEKIWRADVWTRT